MQTKFELTEDQRNTIVHGLYVAAERFDEHVKTAGDDPKLQRLAEQFLRQALDSHYIAELISDAESITIATRHEDQGAIWDGKAVAGGTFERGE